MEKKYVVIAIDGDGDIATYTGDNKFDLAKDIEMDYPGPIRFLQVVEISIPEVAASKIDISKVPVTKVTVKA